MDFEIKFGFSVSCIAGMLMSGLLIWLGLQAGLVLVADDGGPASTFGWYYLFGGATVAIIYGIGYIVLGTYLLLRLNRWVDTLRSAVVSLRQGEDGEWEAMTKRLRNLTGWIIVCGLWALAGVVNYGLAVDYEQAAGSVAGGAWAAGLESVKHASLALSAASVLFVIAIRIRGAATEPIVRDVPMPQFGA